MNMLYKRVSRRTHYATVYVGLKVRKTNEVIEQRLIESACQDYCTDVGLCVTVTPTLFVYKDGNEPGVIIGLINYPRFPSSQRTITKHALALAEWCLRVCRQCRVSVVTPRRTYMISDAGRIAESESK